MARYLSDELMIECPECLATFSELEGEKYKDKFQYSGDDVLFGCPQCKAAIVKYDESTSEWIRREYLKDSHPYVSVKLNFDGGGEVVRIENWRRSVVDIGCG